MMKEYSARIQGVLVKLNGVLRGYESSRDNAIDTEERVRGDPNGEEYHFNYDEEGCVIIIGVPNENEWLLQLENIRTSMM